MCVYVCDEGLYRERCMYLYVYIYIYIPRIVLYRSSCTHVSFHEYEDEINNMIWNNKNNPETAVEKPLYPE